MGRCAQTVVKHQVAGNCMASCCRRLRKQTLQASALEGCAVEPWMPCLVEEHEEAHSLASTVEEVACSHEAAEEVACSPHEAEVAYSLA
mmetsp:Transcript_66907/g.118467  ORF Transcript_66907/g.118467 Transcript_66907/m.118467 type:complete len:89 (+) Transcript_66907:514-780(+)